MGCEGEQENEATDDVMSEERRMPIRNLFLKWIIPRLK
jgi:hypothetical protein